MYKNRPGDSRLMAYLISGHGAILELYHTRIMILPVCVKCEVKVLKH